MREGEEEAKFQEKSANLLEGNKNPTLDTDCEAFVDF